ncbi:putative CDK5 regulatory subunit-associated protein 3 [Paratrimastix pyriformis]|uniref:CDK5 regulatory subunit-associated protein 3 n=1 Tax=Paratrimastix pyriformis TaxID=342808 RepID=A0ABQ8UWW2_9EUKA|nr:putative CDK5 regulatory subunit-associated protein 3 [Paratrimastix pyriformis]
MALRFRTTPAAPAQAATTQLAKGQPLDIAYQNVYTWLVENRKLASSFPHDLQEMRAKLSTAIDQLPTFPEFEQTAQEKDSLTYFDCMHIFDILREKNPQKTLIGSFTDPIVREWSTLMKAYTKSNLHLGDSAQRLTSLISADLPAQRKILAKQVREIEELRRKEDEALSASKRYEKQFERDCGEMGVQGRADLKAELVAQLPALPSMLAKFLKTLVDDESLRKAVSMYRGCVTHISRHGSDTSGPVEAPLPILAEVLALDPTTLEKYLAAPQPPAAPPSEPSASPAILEVVSSSTEAPPPSDLPASADSVTAADTTAPSAQGGSDGAALQIDWGDLTDPNLLMSWDDGAAAGAVPAGEAVPSSAGPLLAGGVVEVESGELAGEGGSDIVVRLGAPRTRRALESDLLELLCFLEQRQMEMGDSQAAALISSSLLTKSVRQSGPSASADASDVLAGPAVLAPMRAAIQRCLSALHERRLEQLLLMKSSQRYTERITAELEQSREHSQRMVRRAEQMADLGREAQATLARETENLQRLLRRGRKLADDLGLAMEALAGRPCHVVGVPAASE